jgi:hypothetical protein
VLSDLGRSKKLKRISAEVNGSPLWNVMPSRNVNSSAMPLSSTQREALTMLGPTDRSGATFNTMSNTQRWTDTLTGEPLDSGSQLGTSAG